MRRIIVPSSLLPYGLEPEQLLDAWRIADGLLAEAPSLFGLGSQEFYAILNQRNLSGLVGEAFKHSLSKVAPGLRPNPHPDGRPDLLDLRSDESARHLATECFDPRGAPVRALLTPFKYGGLEFKATIGDMPSVGRLPIGRSRAAHVTNINFWAHHQHECHLMGLYYDFDEASGGLPQIKAIFYAPLVQAYWAPVSIGRAGSKKTSNTSLLREGRDAIKKGIVGLDDSDLYRRVLARVGVVLPEMLPAGG